MFKPLAILRRLFTRKPAALQKKRVVIDTNSLVAARFKGHGKSSRLIDCCVAGDVQAVVSKPIIHENELILRKVKPSKEYWQRLEAFYKGAELVEEWPSLTVSEDPADNKFVECAVAASADYIISSDHHLLDLDGYEGICICHSSGFFSENPDLK